jgi:general secretion pathway protein G
MLKAVQARAARRGEQGFTLIELLIVIVILGILAAIVVFSVSGITGKGQDSACKADYATVTTAEEAYFAGDGTATLPGGAYTSTVQDLVDAGLLHSDPGTVAVTLVAKTPTKAATFTVAGATGSKCDGVAP